MTTQYVKTDIIAAFLSKRSSGQCLNLTLLKTNTQDRCSFLLNSWKYFAFNDEINLIIKKQIKEINNKRDFSFLKN